MLSPQVAFPFSLFSAASYVQLLRRGSPQEVDLIARQYSAMCIGNLAAEPDNHIKIVK